MPESPWPHRVKISIDVEGENLNEIIARCTDPGNRCYKREHPSLEKGSDMYCSEHVSYVWAPPVGTPFGIRIERRNDFIQLSHHVGYLIVIDGRDMCFIHETSENTKESVFHKVVTNTFIRRSAVGRYENHPFTFQDVEQHEDRDSKGADGQPLIGTIEVRAYHLKKSVLVAPHPVAEDEPIRRQNALFGGRPSYAEDMPQIDVLSKRAVRADREIVKNVINESIKSVGKTWASSGIQGPNFGVLIEDLDKFDDQRTRAAVREPFAIFKLRFRT